MRAQIMKVLFSFIPPLIKLFKKTIKQKKKISLFLALLIENSHSIVLNVFKSAVGKSDNTRLYDLI